MERLPDNTRRLLVLGFAGMASGIAHGAATADWQAALANSFATHDALTLGHKLLPTSDPAWREVDDLLAGAPATPTAPQKVAQYLASTVPLKYREAWHEPDIKNPTFANPLIVRLFLATRTVPSGDTTPWCAAFVNWCVQRSGATGTASASSQSFLGWGKEIWSKSTGGALSVANPGDVTVFRKRSDPAHGHVGFFNGMNASMGNHVDVLGGNQIESNVKYQKHLIDVKPLRIDGDLELFSIRRLVNT
jgi:uncharacterized protein (TIGR02594 family)